MRTYEGQEITLELYKTDDDIDDEDDHELSDGGKLCVEPLMPVEFLFTAEPSATMVHTRTLFSLYGTVETTRNERRFENFVQRIVLSDTVKSDSCDNLNDAGQSLYSWPG